VKAARPTQTDGTPIEIWFQDEARIGQKGTLTRLWARRGSRPAAPRDHRCDWAYLFGAVCPARTASAALVLPSANAEMMNLHLNAISRQVAHGAHGVVVIDGAGYHKPEALELPANLSILTLPPYSPELNPVENIWQYLRQNFLANRVFADYDAIVDACCNAWNALVNLPHQLASITQRSWAKPVIN
jgi:transposase